MVVSNPPLLSRFQNKGQNRPSIVIFLDLPVCSFFFRALGSVFYQYLPFISTFLSVAFFAH